ncbi:translation initiation factor IF-2-like [Grus japonensis]|uniref:Translation initiation factor IF-2-like n=1 Tax=Grus japonensis TaxID=30415 RepID=A0ABC9WHE7_GRUJA
MTNGRVQQRTTKMFWGLDNMIYEDKLRELVLLNLEKRREEKRREEKRREEKRREEKRREEKSMYGPNTCLQLPKGELQRRQNQTFLRLAQQEDKRQQSQAAIREILTGYKEEFFTVEVVKRWNRLPKEVVKSPNLDIFKTQLVKTPHNQV